MVATTSADAAPAPKPNRKNPHRWGASTPFRAGSLLPHSDLDHRRLRHRPHHTDGAAHVTSPSTLPVPGATPIQWVSGAFLRAGPGHFSQRRSLRCGSRGGSQESRSGTIGSGSRCSSARLRTLGRFVDDLGKVPVRIAESLAACRRRSTPPLTELAIGPTFSFGEDGGFLHLTGHCHDKENGGRTATGMHDKHQTIEEPCEGKLSCTVLQPRPGWRHPGLGNRDRRPLADWE